MDEHEERIQADKPVSPWERPGCFRLDYEPHRGTLLLMLALPSLAFACLSLFPCCLGVPNLLGISLGLTTW